MLPNTLALLESIEHLGEVARLMFVFARRGKPRMEESALIEACKRTAGISSRYPRPRPALNLALNIGLVNLSQNVVTLTDIGRTFSSAANPISLDLSLAQSQLLLGALLDDSIIEMKLKSFVSHFQPVRKDLLVRKNVISSDSDQRLFCRLLQQIGALKMSGDYYILIRPFDQILEHVIVSSARLSQAELWKRLERQRERGVLAEKKVVELEKSRLSLLNRPDLAAKVERISVDDVSAGFDVRSFENNDKPRFIEVKSCVGAQVLFEWSEGERAKARTEGSAYYIYFVPFSFSLPKLTAPVVAIRDPLAHIANGALIEIPSNYKVRETSGDTSSFKTIADQSLTNKNRIMNSIIQFDFQIRRNNAASLRV